MITVKIGALQNFSTMQNHWRINSKIKKLLLAFLGIVLLYAGLVFVLRAIGLENLHLTVRQMGVWAPAAFVLISVFSVILAPISSSSIFATGGILFGQHVGFLLSFLSSIVGCCTNFWISRKLGRAVVARFIGHDSLAQLDRFTARLNHRHSIAFMMLIMPVSHDMVSYAVGLTKVKFWQFFIALFVSGFVTIAAYVYLGTSILEALISR